MSSKNQSLNQLPIKSASIILQKSDGSVLICKRSKTVSFFPGFWVFPGGKIESDLPNDWLGDENEVKETVLQELYEEVGIIPGSRFAIPPEKRNEPLYYHDYDIGIKKEFMEEMAYIGRKKTPPFRKKTYEAKVRASVDDPETAQLLQINTDKILFYTFALGCGLAGLAGITVAPILGVEPGMDMEVLVLTLIVVVVGGPGSLKGAIIGSLLIGFVDSFGKVYIPQLAQIIIYAVMALTLLFKPDGLYKR